MTLNPLPDQLIMQIHGNCFRLAVWEIKGFFFKLSVLAYVISAL